MEAQEQRNGKENGAQGKVRINKEGVEEERSSTIFFGAKQKNSLRCRLVILFTSTMPCSDLSDRRRRETKDQV